MSLDTAWSRRSSLTSSPESADAVAVGRTSGGSVGAFKSIAMALTALLSPAAAAAAPKASLAGLVSALRESHVNQVYIAQTNGSSTSLAAVVESLDGATDQGEPASLWVQIDTKGQDGPYAAMLQQHRLAGNMTSVLNPVIARGVPQRGHQVHERFRRHLDAPGVEPKLLSIDAQSAWTPSRMLQDRSFVVATMDKGSALLRIKRLNTLEVPWLVGKDIGIDPRYGAAPGLLERQRKMHGIFEQAMASQDVSPALVATCDSHYLIEEYCRPFTQHHLAQGYPVIEVPLCEGFNATVAVDPAALPRLRQYAKEAGPAVVLREPAKSATAQLARKPARKASESLGSSMPASEDSLGSLSLGVTFVLAGAAGFTLWKVVGCALRRQPAPLPAVNPGPHDARAIDVKPRKDRPTPAKVSAKPLRSSPTRTPSTPPSHGRTTGTAPTPAAKETTHTPQPPTCPALGKQLDPAEIAKMYAIDIAALRDGRDHKDRLRAYLDQAGRDLGARLKLPGGAGCADAAGIFCGVVDSTPDTILAAWFEKTDVDFHCVVQSVKDAKEALATRADLASKEDKDRALRLLDAAASALESRRRLTPGRGRLGPVPRGRQGPVEGRQPPRASASQSPRPRPQPAADSPTAFDLSKIYKEARLLANTATPGRRAERAGVISRGEVFIPSAVLVPHIHVRPDGMWFKKSNEHHAALIEGDRLEAQNLKSARESLDPGNPYDAHMVHFLNWLADAGTAAEAKQG